MDASYFERLKAWVKDGEERNLSIKIDKEKVSVFIYDFTVAKGRHLCPGDHIPTTEELAAEKCTCCGR